MLNSELWKWEIVQTAYYSTTFNGNGNGDGYEITNVNGKFSSIYSEFEARNFWQIALLCNNIVNVLCVCLRTYERMRNIWKLDLGKFGLGEEKKRVA